MQVHKLRTASTLRPIKTGFTLTNGLIERSFYTLNGVLVASAFSLTPLLLGAYCTVELKHLSSKQTFLRGLTPEGNTTLNGQPFDIGGCVG